MMSKKPKNNVVITLTATIVPNSIFVAHQDDQKRRQEYIDAIDYYAKFGEVFFLENSSYDLMSDPEFQRHPNVHLRKFPISEGFARGKGYQEFEMINRWISSEKMPFTGFIKVTGRYFAQNFNELLEDCQKEENYQVIIEQKIGKPIAHTSLFYVSKAYYLKNLFDIYKECNDLEGIWIEHLVRSKITLVGEFRTFKWMPMIIGISGSSLKKKKISAGKKIKYYLRRFIHHFYKKYRLI